MPSKLVAATTPEQDKQEYMARLIAGHAIASRLQLHKYLHAVLTMMLFWPAYLFLDTTPSITPEVQVYHWMAGVMTEAHWGWCCLIPALFGSLTLYARAWQVRMAGAGVLSAAHAALAISLALGKRDAAIVGFVTGFAFAGAALAYSTANIGIRFARSLEGSRNKRPLAG